MSSPLIGITTSRIYNRYGFSQIGITEAYIKAVSRTGATPLLIPLGLPDEAYLALLEHLDGVLFTGGGDVQPERYGGQQHPLVREMDPDRDRVEISLVKDCLPARKPFLGICRGLQLINVAMGGSLYEDLKAEMGYDYWKNYIQDKSIEKALPRLNCKMSDDELNQYIKNAYREFYFRPGFILKTVCGVKSVSELTRYVKAGLSMLRD